MTNQTVEQVLAAANDSVSLINDINTNGGDSEYSKWFITKRNK